MVINTKSIKKDPSKYKDKIKVKFPRVTTIKSITTQGLYNTKQLWVKTYNLLYSMDAFTWATVTSQDGSPLLFDGNNTPVTTAVLPNVDALAIRIKPVSWNIYPVLRFDVGGCHERTRNDILDYYGYKESLGGAFLYNVIEVRKDKVNASVTCTEHLTRLFRIDTKSRMANLHDVISRSDIFKNIYKFYVSGGYTSLGRWMHDGEDDEINIALWSPDNPNATHGHCVLLTQTGLTSVDCAEKHYSICGH
ncbi:uncharacterized protein LOC132545362 [Ylistrum balloti]|uniref:uncharacterized protein LOC132545362 n=1 Tax=Ylistrum balloti TaxID=509963 RepID=UPI002905B526|nr:uncharacterized protein LOC132545362 [Ylistrum balloti]